MCGEEGGGVKSARPPPPPLPGPSHCSPLHPPFSLIPCTGSHAPSSPPPAFASASTRDPASLPSRGAAQSVPGGQAATAPEAAGEGRTHARPSPRDRQAAGRPGSEQGRATHRPSAELSTPHSPVPGSGGGGSGRRSTTRLNQAAAAAAARANGLDGTGGGGGSGWEKGCPSAHVHTPAAARAGVTASGDGMLTPQAAARGRVASSRTGLRERGEAEVRKKSARPY